MAAAAPPPIDRGAAWLGLLAVVLGNLRYLSGLGAILDPMLAMEPYYIHMAGRPVAEILRQPPAWGPLYGLWLKPFVAALGDPLAVYAANLWALSLAVSALVYVHLLLLTRRAAVAGAAALLFLVSDANVPLASKVSGFALLVLLAGWTAALCCGPGARRASVLAAGALAAAYARPELSPAAGLLWLWALWRAWQQRRAGATGAFTWPLGALALASALALALGMPASGGDRLLDAFREHFAWNWAAWHGHWRFYQAVWDDEFGGARTLGAALVANPGAVAHHLASNAFGALRFLVDDAFRHYPLLASPGSPLGVAGEAWLVAALVLAALAAAALRPAPRRALWGGAGDVLVAYAVVAASSLAAAVAVYPRAHYLAIPSVLLLLAGAQAAAVFVPSPALGSLGARVLAVAAGVAIVPRPFVLPSAYAVAGSPFLAQLSATRPVTDTVAFVRGLGLAPPVRVLAMTDGMGELLGPGFEEVKVWQKGRQPLADYLRDQHVAVIVALRLGRDSFVVDDPLWTVIQIQPEAAGFRRLAVPGHDGIGVFVRRDAPLPGDGAP